MTRNRFRGLGRTTHGVISTLLLALVCLLAGVFQVAPAAAACPNEVFRSGPSAKLPECRAYELVTPAYTGGIRPRAGGFLGTVSAGEFPLIDSSGSSVIFNTAGGALPGTEGTGFVDRYLAKRTSEGWATQSFGPSAAESPRSSPGAASPDHLYYFLNAGFNDIFLEPEGTLQAPFGGHAVDYLRKPNGEYELLAKGSIGSSPRADGHLITPGASHVIFSTSTQLEPEAPPTGTEAIYDRSPGGATHVVSLLPGNVTPTQGYIEYNGASEDGSDVAFTERDSVISFARLRLYVRHDNAVTDEVARANGLHVGEELTCSGPGDVSAASVEWLRNGSVIPGATGASYTVAPADAGTVLQCQVAYSDSGGEVLQTALPPLVVAPYIGKNPPYLPEPQSAGTGASVSAAHTYAEVGESITCEPGDWEGSPTYGYSWYRNGAPIAGATSATYLVGAADEETALQCRVSATNADGTAVGFSEIVMVHPSPAFASAAPTLTNVTDPGSNPAVGDELSCASGTWSEEPTFSFRWLRNGAAVAGATESTYTVVSADEGTALQCLVTATTTSGPVTQATSSRVVVDPQPGTAPPEPSETGFVPPGGISSSGGASSGPGDALFCSEGESWDGAPTFEFQWLRDGSPIGGATESAYLLTDADVGTTLQCRLTATNAGGTTVVLYAGSAFGPRLVTPRFPYAFPPDSPAPGITYAGIYGGNVFYADHGGINSVGQQPPGDLFSYDTGSGTTTRITDVGDASFSNISSDGSHVFFVSESQIDGQGTPGVPNLYIWSRADESTKFIASVEPQDVSDVPLLSGGFAANLASWTMGQSAFKDQEGSGLGEANTRSTPDGSVFLFETTAQLTSFDNTEANPEDCGSKFTSGDRCLEAYVYEAGSEEVHCISCPPGGSGPAIGFVSLWEAGPLVPFLAPQNLTQDGEAAVFESTEDLLPRDGNGHKDVYIWRKGRGLSLISTGQSLARSVIYSLTPDGSDVTFITSEPLVPGDRNGETERIYDARVNGGFPPPDNTVTEPCSGDACQGSPGAAPEAANVGSSSLSGTGNVHEKLRCGKHKRRVVRHGQERCVKRRHRHRHRHHHRQSHGPARNSSR